MSFFQQPGEEREEIRAGASLAPMENGQPLVKNDKHVFKTLMCNTETTTHVKDNGDRR